MKLAASAYVIMIILFVGAVSAFAESCTLRIGAFSGPAAVIGTSTKPKSDEAVSGINVTAISKENKKVYQSIDIVGIRYFQSLPQGTYRLIVSKPGFRTAYCRYELDCGGDSLSAITWSVRLSPGLAKPIENYDPDPKPGKSIAMRENIKTIQGDSDVAYDGSVAKEVITGGRAIYLPEPRLSSWAKDVNFSGKVLVEVFVDAFGKVIRSQAVSGHPLLLADCENAALFSMFSPKIIDGTPVSFVTEISYPFGTQANTLLFPKPSPKTVTGGFLNGKAMSLPKPTFPPAAKAVRASGTVTVQVLIDVNGSVLSAKSVSGNYTDITTESEKSGVHPLLASAAESAAMLAKFSPTLLGGNPVKVVGIIVYRFVP